MAVSRNNSFSSATHQRVLRLLENLNASSTGSTIFKHIERSFKDLDAETLEYQLCLYEMLALTLDTLIAQLNGKSPHLIEAHIIKKSLIPGLSVTELKTLSEQIQALLSEIQHTNRPESILTRQAFSAFSNEFENTQASPSTEVQPESHTVLDNKTVTDEPITTQNQETKTESNNQQIVNTSQQNVDLAYRHHLDKTRDNIQTIQSNLSEQVSNAIKFNGELTEVLQKSIDAMRVAETIEDIRAAKNTYIQQCNNLIRSQQDLITKFDSIHVGLVDIESNSQNLDDELTRVHLLSLTDELTELPNRRALMQRMDDEVARVQRYGYPLVLAIIDLDEFKPINDRFGHSAGDAVLKHFSNNIFSVFRHHDTVARYGGEEFAVLMPNTEIDGALCALKKVQSRLEETPCYLDSGIEIASPTFSAGIALYNPGETPDELIKRSDMAMYRAKRMGRNRIEVHTMGTKSTSQTGTQ